MATLKKHTSNFYSISFSISKANLKCFHSLRVDDSFCVWAYFLFKSIPVYMTALIRFEQQVNLKWTNISILWHGALYCVEREVNWFRKGPIICVFHLVFAYALRIHSELQEGLIEGGFFFQRDCPKPSASKFKPGYPRQSDSSALSPVLLEGWKRAGTSRIQQRGHGGLEGRLDMLPWFDLTSESRPAGIAKGKEDISAL